MGSLAAREKPAKKKKDDNKRKGNENNFFDPKKKTKIVRDLFNNFIYFIYLFWRENKEKIYSLHQALT